MFTYRNIRAYQNEYVVDISQHCSFTLDRFQLSLFQDQLIHNNQILDILVGLINSFNAQRVDLTVDLHAHFIEYIDGRYNFNYIVRVNEDYYPYSDMDGDVLEYYKSLFKAKYHEK